MKPKMQGFVEDQVNAGRYSSADEVIQAGLELLERQQIDLCRIREQAAVGLAQARRGEGIDGETAFDEIFGPLDTASAM